MSIIEELVANLGFGFGDCLRIIASGPARYFVFEINKRSGGRRLIAQPARELKAMQRYILDEKLSRLPVHRCAMAYKTGASIRRNALVHSHSHSILKLDFKEFFPSILPSDWFKFTKTQKVLEMSRQEAEIYAKILFWGKIKNNITPQCLSIGAPTSPSLSNILMYELDEEINNICEKLNINYSRYADDITLSSSNPRLLEEGEKNIRRIISKTKSPSLVFNESKRGLFTKGGRRSVTGLILTPDCKVSIGRERKRSISAMLHHFKTGDLSPDQKATLKGLLAFAISAEVSFVERLRSKYGNKTVDEALKFYVPRKNLLY